MEIMGQEALLDTTVLIDHLRGRRSGKHSLFQESLLAFDSIFVSSISIYEVEIGSILSGRSSDIKPLLSALNILNFTEDIAVEAAKIYAELRKKRALIESHDIFIAATARFFGLPLITQNLSHFQRIDRLDAANHVKKSE